MYKCTVTKPVCVQVKKQGSNNVNNNNNKNKKRRDEDAGGHNNRKQKSKNDFEDWCSRALSDLQAQVDIPTFLGFLMDIESPYDVSYSWPLIGQDMVT